MPSQLGDADDVRDALRKKIVETTLAVQSVRHGIRGVLYFGLMLTTSGPSVLEYNVRFGDPETQAVLRRLDTDFAEICLAVAREELEQLAIVWSGESATAIVVASSGYPGSFETGKVISGIDEAEQMDDVIVFQAGTWKAKDGSLMTAGGRVLAVTVTGQL